MDKKLVEQIISEAKDAEANLGVWDKRDTFTVEKEDVEKIEVSDGYLKASMQDDKATVYVELAEIYKLVVEKEKAKKGSSRTGFGA
jgi:secreted trypsin-like serine protease